MAVVASEPRIEAIPREMEPDFESLEEETSGHDDECECQFAQKCDKHGTPETEVEEDQGHSGFVSTLALQDSSEYLESRTRVMTIPAALIGPPNRFLAMLSRKYSRTGVATVTTPISYPTTR